MKEITLKQVVAVLEETTIEASAISIYGKGEPWFEIRLKPQAFTFSDLETIKAEFSNAIMNFGFTVDTLTISVHPRLELE